MVSKVSLQQQPPSHIVTLDGLSEFASVIRNSVQLL